MAHWPGADHCPCGWHPGSGHSHNHAQRLRKFWEARLASQPPKKFKPNKPKRRERETVDA